jgi:hypothetical protein
MVVVAVLAAGLVITEFSIALIIIVNIIEHLYEPPPP